jgi:hydroxyquinol 1,2-dioxygenase
MKPITEQTITHEVLASLKASDPRTQEILMKLVTHLHAFVRDLEPTETEWGQAIAFLTRTGHTCTDKRQEFILLSDVLGVSMLVDAINHRSGKATETTVTGPFHIPSQPLPMGSLIAQGPEAERGEPTLVRGTVSDTDGHPLTDATVEVWQADDIGYYDIQDSNQPDLNLRGIFTTGADGTFWFKTIKPAPYPIPDDGPVGDLLKAANRHPMRPAHIHFWIKAAGFQPIITHLFVAGDTFLLSDAVFGVKNSLILEFNLNSSSQAAEEWGFVQPFYDVFYDFKLAKEDS